MNVARGLWRYSSAVAVLTLVLSGCPSEKPPAPPPPPKIVLPDATLADATVGLDYSASLKATGGEGALTHSAEGLPAGLKLGTDGALSGAATESGDFSVTLTVKDTASQSVSKVYPLRVFDAVAFTTTTLPGGTAESDYTATVEVAGGKAPVAVTIASGELPGGVTFDPATLTLAGVPVAAGNFSFVLNATDANGASKDQPFTIAVAPKLEITTASLANGNINLAYTQTLKAQGGKSPLSWELVSGMLPDGLTLDAATGKLAGTPTAAGPADITFGVRDANGALVTAQLPFTIYGNAPPQVATTTLPNAVVGVPYSQNLVGAEGAPPYHWTVTSGTPPDGVTLSDAGVLAGTPTTAGPQAFQVTLTDANGQTAVKALTLTVFTQVTISTASLPDGYTSDAYTQTLSATGGQPPYTWAVVGGALPSGVTLSSGGILSGTPSAAGSFGVTIGVTDASGQNPTRPFTMTIFSPPSFASSALADGVIGASYSQALQIQGGKPPLSYALSGGALPPGISLINNTLAGTPTTAGTFPFGITVTDGGGKTATATLSIHVYATLAVTTGNLPEAYVGTAYSEILTAAGGATPYQWTVTSGTLPAGLTLSSSGTLSGTPTTSGTANFTVQVTAANSATATKPLSLTVRTQPSITTPSLSDGYVGESYSATLAATGGKLPYSFAVTQGALPAGVTLSSSGVISGTPTQPGNVSITVTLTDGNGVTATAQYAFGVFAALQVTTTSLADGYVGSAYSRTVAATGGKTPLSWSISSGALPNGLSLASGGNISGTPSTTGTALFTAQVTDANGRTSSAPLSIAVFAQPVVATSTLPDGTLNTAYSATLVANGGKAPLTWTVASGALPQGLTLASNGTVSGTPTAAGTASFTVAVADANNVSAAAQLSIVVYNSLTISSSSPLPDAYAQVPYSLSLQAAGGKAPFTWAITSGQLPAGLNLSSSGTISGTATGAANATFTATVTDFNGTSASKPFTLNAIAAPSIVTTTLTDGYVGLPYSATVVGQNGKQPYAFTVSTGSLPAGVSLTASTGELSGAPTTKGSSTFEVTLTDANGLISKRTYIVGIYDAPAVTTASPLADGYQGTSYLQQFAGTGGKTPYTWSVASGSLPAGLTLAANGDLSGTPTTAGAYAYSVKLTDANAQVATKSFTQTVRAPLAIATAALDDGYVGAAYPATQLSATGGKSPYTFAVSAGALPGGVTLTPGGVLSGTPTGAGTASFTVTVTDANAVTATRSLSLAVFAPPSVTTASLPDAYASTAYTQTLTASGGKTPLTWTVSAGALPAGLSLSTAGVLSGTTTATGTFNFTVSVTDANSVSGTRALSLLVLPTLQVTTTTLADGYVGDAYSATVAASGGKTPYSFAVTTGTLPAGLTLTGATLAGTPTSAAASTFTLTVTDANGRTASQALTLTVYAKPVITSASLPDGYAGSAYSAQLTNTGGKAPISYAVTSGTLPGGINLSSSGAFSGTPAAAGNSTFTLTLTDANGQTATKSLTLVVLQALSISTASLPDAYTGSVYSATLAGAGGKTPYTFTLNTGSTLPSGLTLAGSGALSGTPTTAGTTNVTFKVTDANGATATRALSIDVLAPPNITTTTAPDGYPGATYSLTLAVTGGRAAFTWSVSAGTLPAGLAFSAAGVLSGTPTTPGTSSFTVQVADANGKLDTQALTLIVRQPLVVSTATLPDGYMGSAYSQTLAASGGLAPYGWAIASGALPGGVTLNASTGEISGTPSAANTFSFTVRVTDANGVTATKSLALATFAMPQISTASPLPSAYKDSAYSQTFAATGGKAPLTWTVSSGALPAGLTLSTAGVLSGTPTTAGASTFTVQVADANGQLGTKSMSLTVLQGFFITTTSLPDGYLTTAYSRTLTASGGLSPYTWAVQSGTLPAGLSLSSAGVLSGTPTVAGSSTFTVVATDANAATTTKSLTLVVRTLPSITTTSLPDAYVGDAYNQAIAGTGGATPYAFTVSPALPAGLTLSSGGTLSGSPSAAAAQATYTFTLTDANGVTATRPLTLAVFQQLQATGPAAADAYVTVAYTYSPTSTGGKTPITWSTTGTKPAWATVSTTTGQVTGTPTAAGAVSFTLVATDANAHTSSVPLSFTVYTLPTISTTTIPTPYVSVAYSTDLTATGGKTPYTWTMGTGTLPPGLSLTTVAGNGRLSGTPTNAGTYTFTVNVTDANGKTDPQSYTVTVPPAPSITTTTLADAYRTTAYSATLAATGGLAPYTFTVSSGTLPTGLSLASSGAISGTVDAMSSSQTFVARVVDQNGTAATKSLTISVYGLPSLSTTSLPDGYVGDAYSQTVAASGGKTPYTFTVSAGTLPAGLSLNGTTGAITGTPTTSGTASFSISVADANNKTATQMLGITVFAPPSITAATFADGYAGSAYSKTLAVTGGKSPYTWSITGGALPPGLTLGSGTGAIGTTIASSGITNGQQFTFTATVVDANSHTANRPFTMTVFLMPQISTTGFTQATEGVTYMKAPGQTESVQVVNGKSPFTFALTGLPSGITVNTTTGVLSGVPAQGSAGPYTVGITVTDNNMKSVTKSGVPLTVVAPKPIPGGGTRSVAPGGSPITNNVTIFVVGPDDVPRAGVGVRVRKDGVEYGTPKEALTDANGKVFLTGLGLNGVNDWLDITVNAPDIATVTMAQINAALVTVPVEPYPLPGGREGASAAWDQATNQMVVFGGAMSGFQGASMSAGSSGSECPNNTVRLSPTNAAWTEAIAPNMPGSIPSPRQGAATAVVNNGAAMMMIGGADCSGSAQATLGDAWLYNFSTNTWSITSGPSTGLQYATVAPSSGPSSAILLGGETFPGNYNLQAYQWNGNSWTLTNFPPPGTGRSRSAGAFMPSTGETVFCGGYNGTVLSNCVFYNPNNFFNPWMTSSNLLPAPRMGHAMAFNPAANVMYLFGGADGNGMVTNSLWVSTNSGPWTIVNASNPPPSRMSHVLAWDSVNSRLVMYGGTNGSVRLDDVWTFSPSTNAWTRQSPARTAPTTYVVSGAITGGQPSVNGNMSSAQLSLTTSSGLRMSGYIVLSNTGTAFYSFPGVPGGDTVTLTAVNLYQVSGNPQPTYYSLADLGTLGPITSDTTQNIAFPAGPLPLSSTTGTFTLPSDWTTTPQATPLLSRTGYPDMALTNGTASITNGAFSASYLLPGTGTSQDLVVSGYDSASSVCESSQTIRYGIATGAIGSIALPGGARSRTPGVTECTATGTGFSMFAQAPVNATPTRLAVGDYDGDGKKDLFVTVSGNSQDSFMVLRNTGNGLVAATGILSPGVSPSGIATLDFNKDGKLDAAVTYPNGNSVLLFLQQPDGTFSTNPISVSVQTPGEIVSGDFNGDTNPDLAVTTSFNNQVVVLTGNGSNALGPPMAYPAQDPRGIGIGEFNGDAFPDLAVACRGDDRIRLYYGSATGAFNPGYMTPQVPNADPTELVVVDFDNNGLADIAVTEPGMNDLRLFLQNAPGSFTAGSTSVLPGGAPAALAAGELTGDTFPDLVVTTTSFGLDQVMQYQAGGTFTQYATFSNTSAPDVVTVDLDGDSKPEFAMAEQFQQVTAWRKLTPLPTVADTSLGFSAPANVGLVSLRRGTTSVTGWIWWGPAPAGTNIITPPLASTLAGSRTLPSGQNARWQPTLYFNGATPIDRNEVTFRLMRPSGIVRSNGMQYNRQ